MAEILVIVGGLALFAVAFIFIKLIKICPANEVFVISGGRRTDERGQRVGYSIVKGGRKLVLPLFERLERLDLTNMIIEVRVLNAYSKGGIPVNVQGVANVKIPGQGPTLSNAVVRLLGKQRVEVMGIAKETLEGNLRGVMARLTPEQLNEDKIKFGHMLVEEAEDDLHSLGLILDTLKIQNVWDDKGYLDSIGRIRNSEIQKTARIAEAEARSLSKVRSAENLRETELARIEASLQTLRAETNQEKAQAMTMKDVLVAKERGHVSAKLAQAKADLQVQKARVEEVRRRLRADIVEPARAQMEEAIADAKGDAKSIEEEGRATAEALRKIAENWTKGGPTARDAFLLTKLDNLMGIITSTVGNLSIERMTVIPGGASKVAAGGNGSGDSSLGLKLLKLNEELKATLGVDASKLLPAAGDSGTSPAPAIEPQNPA